MNASAFFEARQVGGAREGQEWLEGANWRWGHRCHCPTSFISSFKFTERHQDGTEHFLQIYFFSRVTFFPRQFSWEMNFCKQLFPASSTGFFVGRLQHSDAGRIERGETTRPNSSNMLMFSETQLILTNNTSKWYNGNHTGATPWCHGSPPGVWKPARKAERVMSLQSLNHIGCPRSLETIRRPTLHTVASRNTCTMQTHQGDQLETLCKMHLFLFPALSNISCPLLAVTRITQTAWNFNWHEEAYILSEPSLFRNGLSPAMLFKTFYCCYKRQPSGIKQNAKENRIHFLKCRDYFKLPGIGSLVATPTALL